MKIKIYTYPDKRPEFISIQKRTFDEFLVDDFEFIVINNGSTDFLRSEIEKICETNGITHHFVENPNHTDPNIACAYPINQSLDRFIKRETPGNISVIMDSDMFLFSKFSISNFMENNEVCAIPQSRGDYKYMWNGIVFINHSTVSDIENFDFGYDKVQSQGDVGANMYNYITKNPNCNFKKINHTPHIHGEDKKIYLPSDIADMDNEEFRFDIIESVILYYGQGSNWNNKTEEYHINKTNLLNYFLEKSIIGDLVLPEYSHLAKYKDFNNLEIP